MKIRIDGKTIKTEDIISIDPVVEREFGDQIYFSFRVNMKHDDYCSFLFNTHIYEGFLCTHYIPPTSQKSKKYWFKNRNFLQSLQQYKDAKEIAQKMRDDIEIIWDMSGQLWPIRDFNSR